MLKRSVPLWILFPVVDSLWRMDRDYSASRGCQRGKGLNWSRERLTANEFEREESLSEINEREKQEEVRGFRVNTQRSSRLLFLTLGAKLLVGSGMPGHLQ